MDFKPRVLYLESQSFVCFIPKPSRRNLDRDMLAMSK